MIALRERYVTLEYRFTSPDGTLLGSSARSGPLTFQVGVGQVIDGLDGQIEGHEEGESLVFDLTPEQAYGERDEKLVTTLPLQTLGFKEVDVGDRVKVQIDNYWYNAVVASVQGETATVDANHPLAGMRLHFECSLVSVSDLPPEGSCCSSGGCGSCGGGCGGP